MLNSWIFLSNAYDIFDEEYCVHKVELRSNVFKNITRLDNVINSLPKKLEIEKIFRKYTESILK